MDGRLEETAMSRKTLIALVGSAAAAMALSACASDRYYGGGDYGRHHGYRDGGHRDRDDNPPGPAGGPGTNWENPPGPRGGPGASPDRPY
jgi:hypothetical protein